MNQKEINSKVIEGYIHFRAIVEVLGKPKKYVEEKLSEHIKLIEKKKEITLIQKEIEKAKKHEETDLFSAFADIEMLATGSKELMEFCFDYMPSSIEILAPEQIIYKSEDFTDFLNDVQARLHTVNMGMQDYKQRNTNLIKNMTTLVKNFVMILLKKPISVDQITAVTGIKTDEVQKLLDALIKENRVEKKGELYTLVQ